MEQTDLPEPPEMEETPESPATSDPVGIPELTGVPDFSEIGIPGVLTGAGALALYWTVGPSLKAIGNVFGELTEYKLKNLLRIGDRISDRRRSGLGSDEAASPHPRLVKELLEEASWIDDEMHQEYLAGLLLNARGSQTDSDLYFTRVVTSLTADQVKLHWLVYRSYEGTTHFKPEVGFNDPSPATREIAIQAARSSWRAYFETEHDWAAAVFGLERAGLVEQIAPRSRGSDQIVAIPSLLGAVTFHRVMNYTPPGIQAIRSDRAQLARINPAYTYAEPPTDAPVLTGAQIISV